jgi:hypothetical protein
MPVVPVTWKAEAEGSQFQGQSRKFSKSLSQNKIKRGLGTTRGLDFEHMIKARAHKGEVRIGKTPKKLASICCP